MSTSVSLSVRNFLTWLDEQQNYYEVHESVYGSKKSSRHGAKRSGGLCLLKQCATVCFSVRRFPNQRSVDGVVLSSRGVVRGVLARLECRGPRVSCVAVGRRRRRRLMSQANETIKRRIAAGRLAVRDRKKNRCPIVACVSH